MTLDEAIKHCEEVADGLTEQGKCAECAAEHRQLADWLKELKVYKERIPSYESGYNDAKREIALSGEYERAYERGKTDAQTEYWIPVSERLPEKYGVYLITWTTSQSKRPFIGISEGEVTGEYDHEHNRFKFEWLLEDYIKTYPNVEVIAWMPLPEPYDVESSKS